MTDLVNMIENLSQVQATMLKPVQWPAPPQGTPVPPLAGGGQVPDREALGAVGGPQQTRTANLINQAYNRDRQTPKRRRVGESEAEAGDNLWATVASRNHERQGGTVRKEQEQDQTPRRHWRQKSLIVNGSSNLNSDDKSFAADISLVAGGVSKNATVGKLTEYLKNKGLVGSYL